MRKKITLILLLLVAGATSSWAQYYYNIRMCDNTGTTQGNTSYLGVDQNNSVPALRGQNTGSAARQQWTFIPVEYTAGQAAEIGWYYIQNSFSTRYLTFNAAGTAIQQATETNLAGVGDRAKWRLIKVSGTNISGVKEDNMYFQLASKLNYSQTTGGGTLLTRNGTTGTALTGTAIYPTTNHSVFLLTLTNTGIIVRNDDQELITNDDPVSPLAGNLVWTGVIPTPTMDDAQEHLGVDVNASLANRLVPVNYTGSADTKLMFGNYASGGNVGDGYYFTRINNGSNMTQNLGTYTTAATNAIMFKIWVRGITDQTLPPVDAGAADKTYMVGRAILTFASGAPVEIPINVPITAITPTAAPTNTDAWYLFSNLVSRTTVNGRRVTKVEVVSDILAQPGEALDVDNMDVSIRSESNNEATFYYKSSGTIAQSRQNVHTLRRVVYTRPGQQEILYSSTNGFAYYRWYTMVGSTETYPAINIAATATAPTTRRMANGIMFFSPPAETFSNGYAVNYTIPTAAANPNFFSDPEATLYCDLSNYTDYAWNGTNNIMTEPTLSVRNVFEFRDGAEIANGIATKRAANEPYEYYEIEAPNDIWLRLTPEYLIGNYWTNVGTTPTRSTRFNWYRIAPGTTPAQMYTVGTGTPLATGGVNNVHNFQGGYPYKYLNYNTAGKAKDAVEYFAVDVGTGTTSATAGTYTQRQRIAVFKVTYKNKTEGAGDAYGAGPVLLSTLASSNYDIFAGIEDKKEVAYKDFDQAINLYGMGTKPLEAAESTYGFVDPNHYTETGTGTHAHHRAPYWSEYGFPQAINNGITDGFSWSTALGVDDVSYITRGMRGNMLYVDASQVPGVFAALDFSESLCRGARLYCSFNVVNLNTSSAAQTNDAEANGTRPNLVMILKTIDRNTKAETIVNRFYTGDIGRYSAGGANVWYQVGFDFVIPAELSNVDMDFRLEIQNNGLNTTGNDFAIDDIRVYRSNPNVKAVRGEDIFCLPDGGVEVAQDLFMSVEVDYDVLELSRTGADGKSTQMYFRFLDPGNETGIPRAFPQYQEGETGTKPVYVNSGYFGTGHPDYNEGEGTYYFGYIDLADFTIEDPTGVWKSSNPIYDGMYIYTNSEEKEILVFEQIIPSYVLNGMDSGDDGYNMGDYWIYVGEGAASLLTPDCSGSASFRIDFDGTDFELVMGDNQFVNPEDLTVCTNSEVDVKAYATNPRTGLRMYAYYDWYYGPQHTYPAEAGKYTYDLSGSYGGTVGTDILFDAISDVPVRHYLAFKDEWMGDGTDPNGGKAWADSEEGNNWTWGEVNYIGYSEAGGYFRHSIPGYTPDPQYVVDGITSATLMDPTDNKISDGTGSIYGSDKRPVDFRTLEQDVGAFRFFYPYLNSAHLPEKVAKFPISLEKVQIAVTDANTPTDTGAELEVDYVAMKYRFSGIANPSVSGDDNWIDPFDESPAYDAYRFTYTDYTDKITDYVGDPTGTPYIDEKSGGLDDWYQYELNPSGVAGIADLNMLLARIRYWVKEGRLSLYIDRTPAVIQTIAPYFMTAFPSDCAFTIDNLDVAPTYQEQLDKRSAICPTPAELKFQAKAWSPDFVYGEVNFIGLPSMPYNNIDDDQYVYTVRLPERRPLMNGGERVETRMTNRFVIPTFYFDEIKNARVRLMKVVDSSGSELLNMTKLSDAPVIQESYIGVIDTIHKNKLIEDIVIPHSRILKIDLNGQDSYQEVSTLDPVETYREINSRWKLSERDENHALEAYPLIYNGYNWFVPNLEHDLIHEGEPLPINTMFDGFTVQNNKLAVEIMANDLRFYQNSQGEALPSPYVANLGTGENPDYHFIPGYTYVFNLEATAERVWPETSAECDLALSFQLKVVPDTIIWRGNALAADEWNLDYNWLIPIKDANGGYTTNPSSNATFSPLPETKVIIPVDAPQYATLEPYEKLLSQMDAAGAPNTKWTTSYDTSRPIISMKPYRENSYVNQDYVVDLTGISVTPFIEFDYNYVPNSADIILFKHGGITSNAQLGRPDLLNYNFAKVDLSLNAVQWYGISAPLRSMYSGDYAFPNANPLSDMRLHNTKNPQTGAVRSDWSKPFNTATAALKAGMAYSLNVGGLVLTTPKNVDDLDEGYTTAGITVETQTFHFPKDNTVFKYYDQVDKSYIYSVSINNSAEDERNYLGRFIYETGNDNAINNPLLTLNAKVDGVIGGEPGAIILGNPFMSHIDFAKFYEVNKAVIAPQYKLLKGTKGKYNAENYISLSGTVEGDLITGIESTDEGLTLTSIPPMQSFVVFVAEGVNGTVSIDFTPEMSVTDAASKLRSTGSFNPKVNLEIESSKGLSSRSLIVLSENSSVSYNVQEDSRLMLIEGITNNVPHVYTIVNNLYLDINRIDDFPAFLPLGVTGGSGALRLKLSGFNSLNREDYNFYFVDIEFNKRILIEDDNVEYNFEYVKNEDNGRFFLVKELKNPTNIDEYETLLSIYNQGQNIHVVSLDGNDIKEVSIYSSSGVLLNRIHPNQQNVMIAQPDHHAVVIVKATTNASTRITKLLLHHN